MLAGAPAPRKNNTTSFFDLQRTGTVSTSSANRSAYRLNHSQARMREASISATIASRAALASSRVSRATVGLEVPGAEDLELVKGLFEEHVAHTRSAHGRAVLASWAKRRWVKVMPHEWRRVLELRLREVG